MTKYRKFIILGCWLLLLVGCADRRPVDPQTRAMLFQYLASRPPAVPNYVQYNAWAAVPQQQICLGGCW